MIMASGWISATLLYRDDIKPGHVIEQFPKAKSIVKPGRKIFLYINAVHPKEGDT